MNYKKFKKIKKTINGKKYILHIADTPAKQIYGFSNIKPKEVSKNHGILFVYPDSKIRTFTMKKTKIKLKIIFCNEDFMPVETKIGIPGVKAIKSTVPAKYVIEIPYRKN